MISDASFFLSKPNKSWKRKYCGFSCTNVAEDWIPQIGMSFGSYEDAFEFWKKYAFFAGFGAQISSGHNRDDKPGF